MLPDIKQRLKQTSMTRQSSQPPPAASNHLLEKHLEMQKAFLVRAEENDQKLIGVMAQLATAVTNIQIGLSQFQSESTESYNNICSLLGKVIKLQGNTIKAERTVVSELQELNKERRVNATVEESIIIGRAKDRPEEQSPQSLRNTKELTTQLMVQQSKGYPKIEILGESEGVTNKFAEDDLLGPNLSKPVIHQSVLEFSEENDIRPAQSELIVSEKSPMSSSKLPLTNERIPASTDRLPETSGKIPQTSGELPPTPSTAATVNRSSYHGEYRDRELIFPLSEPIEGITLHSKSTYEQVADFLPRWIGKCYDIMTKEAFAGYYSKAMLESETKVFLCNNIILNFHRMVEFIRSNYPDIWLGSSSKIIALFQEESSKAIGYYLSKYPQKKKVFIGSDIQNLIQTKDELDNPENSMLGRLGTYFPSNEQGDYMKSIKLFLNAIIKEAQNFLPSFKELMKEIFTVEDANNQPYHVDHLIGMKFRQNMPIYTDEEIDQGGVDIKSPEVLRVIIKWTEELEEIANNPRKEIGERTQPYLNRNGPPLDIGRMFRDRVAGMIAGMKDDYLESKFIMDILDSAYCDLAEYIRLRRGEFNYLPQSTLESGMTVYVLEEITSTVAVLVLNKLISFFNLVLAQCHPNNVHQSRHNFKLEDIQFVPFTVCDLLRAKCSGKLSEIKRVFENLKKANIKIVRVKNRLQSSNRDFLINFYFGNECRIMCELQVGLKDSSDDKQMFLDHYNHFLYQLCRSKYGVLSESVMIMSNLTEVGGYFGKKIKPLGIRTREMLNLKLATTKDGGITLVGYDRQENNFSFLCSNCLELRKAFESEQPPWRFDKSLVCSYCVFAGLDKQDRAMYLMGQTGVFYEETPKPSKTDTFIALVPENKIGCSDFYSTRFIEPWHLDNREGNPYYMAFGNFEQFYGRDLVSRKKVFRLREGTQMVTLRFNFDLQQHEGILIVNLKKQAVNPQELEKITDVDKPRQLGLQFSDSLKKQPTQLGLTRCAVHPTLPYVLGLDHEPEGAEPHKQINNKLMRFEHRKKLARLVKSNDTQWMLANQGYDEESFRDVPENNKLEWLYLDRGLFKRLDFFRSTSLTNLHIPLCQITDITLNGNYPELTQLDLMKNKVKKFDGLNSCRKLKKLGLDMNEIEVLDLTILDLPCLEQLNLNQNKISKIIADDKQPTVRLPKLKQLIIGKDLKQPNSLTEFDLKQTVLPELEKLQLSMVGLKKLQLKVINLPSLAQLRIQGNPDITQLDISAFSTLVKLEANNCSIERLTLSASNPRLEDIKLDRNRLQSFDVAGIGAPALKQLNLSHNRIKSFKLNGDWNHLEKLSMSSNGLEDIEFIKEIKSAKSIVPGDDCQLHQLDLTNNRLKKLDLKPLGRITWLKRLELEYNELGEVLFAEEDNLFVYNIKLAYNPRPYSNRVLTLRNFISLKELSIGISCPSAEYCWWKLSQMSGAQLKALGAAIEAERQKDASIPEGLLGDCVDEIGFLRQQLYYTKVNPKVIKLVDVFCKLEGENRNDYQKNALDKLDYKTLSEHGDEFIVLNAGP